jgi:hypothetical protein
MEKVLCILIMKGRGAKVIFFDFSSLTDFSLIPLFNLKMLSLKRRTLKKGDTLS